MFNNGPKKRRAPALPQPTADFYNPLVHAVPRPVSAGAGTAGSDFNAHRRATALPPPLGGGGRPQAGGGGSATPRPGTFIDATGLFFEEAPASAWGLGSAGADRPDGATASPAGEDPHDDPLNPDSDDEDEQLVTRVEYINAESAAIAAAASRPSYGPSGVVELPDSAMGLFQLPGDFRMWLRGHYYTLALPGTVSYDEEGAAVGSDAQREEEEADLRERNAASRRLEVAAYVADGVLPKLPPPQVADAALDAALRPIDAAYDDFGGLFMPPLQAVAAAAASKAADDDADEAAAAARVRRMCGGPVAGNGWARGLPPPTLQLLRAVRALDSFAVKDALDRGADPNARDGDYDGNSILHTVFLRPSEGEGVHHSSPQAGSGELVTVHDCDDREPSSSSSPLPVATTAKLSVRAPHDFAQDDLAVRTAAEREVDCLLSILSAPQLPASSLCNRQGDSFFHTCARHAVNPLSFLLLLRSYRKAIMPDTRIAPTAGGGAVPLYDGPRGDTYLHALVRNPHLSGAELLKLFRIIASEFSPVPRDDDQQEKRRGTATETVTTPRGKTADSGTGATQAAGNTAGTAATSRSDSAGSSDDEAAQSAAAVGGGASGARRRGCPFDMLNFFNRAYETVLDVTVAERSADPDVAELQALLMTWGALRGEDVIALRISGTLAEEAARREGRVTAEHRRWGRALARFEARRQYLALREAVLRLSRPMVADEAARRVRIDADRLAAIRMFKAAELKGAEDTRHLLQARTERRAAVVVQSWWRGSHARREVAVLRMFHRRKYAAAALIQRCYRQRLQRRRAEMEAAQAYLHAVRALQCFARRQALEKRVIIRELRVRKRVDVWLAEATTQLERSAVHVQRVVRGFLGRRRFWRRIRLLVVVQAHLRTILSKRRSSLRAVRNAATGFIAKFLVRRTAFALVRQLCVRGRIHNATHRVALQLHRETFVAAMHANVSLPTYLAVVAPLHALNTLPVLLVGEADDATLLLSALHPSAATKALRHRGAFSLTPAAGSTSLAARDTTTMRDVLHMPKGSPNANKRRGTGPAKGGAFVASGLFAVGRSIRLAMGELLAGLGVTREHLEQEHFIAAASSALQPPTAAVSASLRGSAFQTPAVARAQRHPSGLLLEGVLPSMGVPRGLRPAFAASPLLLLPTAGAVSAEIAEATDHAVADSRDRFQYSDRGQREVSDAWSTFLGESSFTPLARFFARYRDLVRVFDLAGFVLAGLMLASMIFLPREPRTGSASAVDMDYFAIALLWLRLVVMPKTWGLLFDLLTLAIGTTALAAGIYDSIVVYTFLVLKLPFFVVTFAAPKAEDVYSGSSSGGRLVAASAGGGAATSGGSQGTSGLFSPIQQPSRRAGSRASPPHVSIAVPAEDDETVVGAHPTAAATRGASASTNTGVAGGGLLDVDSNSQGESADDAASRVSDVSRVGRRVAGAARPAWSQRARGSTATAAAATTQQSGSSGSTSAASGSTTRLQQRHFFFRCLERYCAANVGSLFALGVMMPVAFGIVGGITRGMMAPGFASRAGGFAFILLRSISVDAPNAVPEGGYGAEGAAALGVGRTSFVDAGFPYGGPGVATSTAGRFVPSELNAWGVLVTQTLLMWVTYASCAIGVVVALRRHFEDMSRAELLAAKSESTATRSATSSGGGSQPSTSSGVASSGLLLLRALTAAKQDLHHDGTHHSPTVSSGGKAPEGVPPTAAALQSIAAFVAQAVGYTSALEAHAAAKATRCAGQPFPFTPNPAAASNNVSTYDDPFLPLLQMPATRDGSRVSRIESSRAGPSLGIVAGPLQGSGRPRSIAPSATIGGGPLLPLAVRGSLGSMGGVHRSPPEPPAGTQEGEGSLLLHRVAAGRRAILQLREELQRRPVQWRLDALFRQYDAHRAAYEEALGCLQQHAAQRQAAAAQPPRPPSTTAAAAASTGPLDELPPSLRGLGSPRTPSTGQRLLARRQRHLMQQGQALPPLQGADTTPDASAVVDNDSSLRRLPTSLIDDGPGLPSFDGSTRSFAASRGPLRRHSFLQQPIDTTAALEPLSPFTLRPPAPVAAASSQHLSAAEVASLRQSARQTLALADSCLVDAVALVSGFDPSSEDLDACSHRDQSLLEHIQRAIEEEGHRPTFTDRGHGLSAAQRAVRRQWLGEVHKREMHFLLAGLLPVQLLYPNTYGLEVAISVIFALELLATIWHLGLDFLLQPQYYGLPTALRLFGMLCGFVPQLVPFAPLRLLRLFEGWGTIALFSPTHRLLMLLGAGHALLFWVCGFAALMQGVALNTSVSTAALSAWCPVRSMTGECLAKWTYALVIPAFPAHISTDITTPAAAAIILVFRFYFLPFFIMLVLHPMLRVTSPRVTLLRQVLVTMQGDLLTLLRRHAEGPWSFEARRFHVPALLTGHCYYDYRHRVDLFVRERLAAMVPEAFAPPESAPFHYSHTNTNMRGRNSSPERGKGQRGSNVATTAQPPQPQDHDEQYDDDLGAFIPRRLALPASGGDGGAPPSSFLATHGDLPPPPPTAGSPPDVPLTALLPTRTAGSFSHAGTTSEDVSSGADTLSLGGSATARLETPRGHRQQRRESSDSKKFRIRRRTIQRAGSPKQLSGTATEPAAAATDAPPTAMPPSPTEAAAAPVIAGEAPTFSPPAPPSVSPVGGHQQQPQRLTADVLATTPSDAPADEGGMPTDNVTTLSGVRDEATQLGDGPAPGTSHRAPHSPLQEAFAGLAVLSRRGLDGYSAFEMFVSAGVAARLSAWAARARRAAASRRRYQSLYRPSVTQQPSGAQHLTANPSRAGSVSFDRSRRPTQTAHAGPPAGPSRAASAASNAIGVTIELGLTQQTACDYDDPATFEDTDQDRALDLAAVERIGRQLHQAQHDAELDSLARRALRHWCAQNRPRRRSAHGEGAPSSDAETSPTRGVTTATAATPLGEAPHAQGGAAATVTAAVVAVRTSQALSSGSGSGRRSHAPAPVLPASAFAVVPLFPRDRAMPPLQVVPNMKLGSGDAGVEDGQANGDVNAEIAAPPEPSSPWLSGPWILHKAHLSVSEPNPTPEKEGVADPKAISKRARKGAIHGEAASFSRGYWHALGKPFCKMALEAAAANAGRTHLTTVYPVTDVLHRAALWLVSGRAVLRSEPTLAERIAASTAPAAPANRLGTDDASPPPPQRGGVPSQASRRQARRARPPTAPQAFQDSPPEGVTPEPSPPPSPRHSQVPTTLEDTPPRRRQAASAAAQQSGGRRHRHSNTHKRRSHAITVQPSPQTAKDAGDTKEIGDGGAPPLPYRHLAAVLLRLARLRHSRPLHVLDLCLLFAAIAVMLVEATFLPRHPADLVPPTSNWVPITCMVLYSLSALSGLVLVPLHAGAAVTVAAAVLVVTGAVFHFTSVTSFTTNPITGGPPITTSVGGSPLYALRFGLSLRLLQITAGGPLAMVAYFSNILARSTIRYLFYCITLGMLFFIAEVIRAQLVLMSAPFTSDPGVLAHYLNETNVRRVQGLNGTTFNGTTLHALSVFEEGRRLFYRPAGLASAFPSGADVRRQLVYYLEKDASMAIGLLHYVLIPTITLGTLASYQRWVSNDMKTSVSTSLDNIKRLADPSALGGFPRIVRVVLLRIGSFFLILNLIFVTIAEPTDVTELSRAGSTDSLIPVGSSNITTTVAPNLNRALDVANTITSNLGPVVESNYFYIELAFCVVLSVDAAVRIAISFKQLQSRAYAQREGWSRLARRAAAFFLECVFLVHFAGSAAISLIVLSDVVDNRELARYYVMVITPMRFGALLRLAYQLLIDTLIEHVLHSFFAALFVGGFVVVSGVVLAEIDQLSSLPRVAAGDIQPFSDPFWMRAISGVMATVRCAALTTLPPKLLAPSEATHSFCRADAAATTAFGFGLFSRVMVACLIGFFVGVALHSFEPLLVYILPPLSRRLYEFLVDGQDGYERALRTGLGPDRIPLSTRHDTQRSIEAQISKFHEVFTCDWRDSLVELILDSQRRRGGATGGWARRRPFGSRSAHNSSWRLLHPPRVTIGGQRRSLWSAHLAANHSGCMPAFVLPHLLEELQLVNPTRQRFVLWMLRYLIVAIPFLHARREAVRAALRRQHLFDIGGPALVSAEPVPSLLFSFVDHAVTVYGAPPSVLENSIPADSGATLAAVESQLDADVEQRANPTVGGFETPDRGAPRSTTAAPQRPGTTTAVDARRPRALPIAPLSPHAPSSSGGDGGAPTVRTSVSFSHPAGGSGGGARGGSSSGGESPSFSRSHAKPPGPPRLSSFGLFIGSSFGSRPQQTPKSAAPSDAAAAEDPLAPLYSTALFSPRLEYQPVNEHGLMYTYPPFIQTLALVESVAILELGFPCSSSGEAELYTDMVAHQARQRAATLLQTTWKMYRTILFIECAVAKACASVGVLEGDSVLNEDVDAFGHTIHNESSIASDAPDLSRTFGSCADLFASGPTVLGTLPFQHRLGVALLQAVRRSVRLQQRRHWAAALSAHSFEGSLQIAKHVYNPRGLHHETIDRLRTAAQGSSATNAKTATNPISAAAAGEAARSRRGSVNSSEGTSDHASRHGTTTTASDGQAVWSGEGSLIEGGPFAGSLRPSLLGMRFSGIEAVLADRAAPQRVDRHLVGPICFPGSSAGAIWRRFVLALFLRGSKTAEDEHDAMRRSHDDDAARAFAPYATAIEGATDGSEGAPLSATSGESGADHNDDAPLPLHTIAASSRHSRSSSQSRTTPLPLEAADLEPAASSSLGSATSASFFGRRTSMRGATTPLFSPREFSLLERRLHGNTSLQGMDRPPRHRRTFSNHSIGDVPMAMPSLAAIPEQASSPVQEVASRARAHSRGVGSATGTPHHPNPTATSTSTLPWLDSPSLEHGPRKTH